MPKINMKGMEAWGGREGGKEVGREGKRVAGEGKEGSQISETDFIMNLNSVGRRRNHEEEKGDRATQALSLALSLALWRRPVVLFTFYVWLAS
jgi:hypothetical protein